MSVDNPSAQVGADIVVRMEAAGRLVNGALAAPRAVPEDLPDRIKALLDGPQSTDREYRSEFGGVIRDLLFGYGIHASTGRGTRGVRVDVDNTGETQEENDHTLAMLRDLGTVAGQKISVLCIGRTGFQPKETCIEL